MRFPNKLIYNMEKPACTTVFIIERWNKLYYVQEKLLYEA